MQTYLCIRPVKCCACDPCTTFHLFRQSTRLHRILQCVWFVLCSTKFLFHPGLPTFCLNSRSVALQATRYTKCQSVPKLLAENKGTGTVFLPVAHIYAAESMCSNASLRVNHDSYCLFREDNRNTLSSFFRERVEPHSITLVGVHQALV